MRILLGLLLAISLGCSPGTYAGASAGTGGSGGQAATPRSFFESNVQPLLSAHCAACHLGPGGPTNAPKFLGASAAGMYDTLKSNSSMTGSANGSLLLTKGTHEGPAWTTSQASTVHLWLVMESSNPDDDGQGFGGAGGSGGTSGSTPPDAGATGGAPDAGTTTGGGACTQLSMCCDQLPSDYQTDCQNLVSGLDPNVCQHILDGLEQQGLCSP